MELREQIADIIDDCQELRDDGFCAVDSEKAAAQILALGLVEIDPDQTPPEFDFSEEAPNMRFGYYLCRDRMIAQNWRKVVKRANATENRL